MAERTNAIAKKEVGLAPKKRAKKAAKHPAKKQPQKAAKRPGRKSVAASVTYAADHGMMTAFHHMQRASVVMSLMKKGTGGDLRGLLKARSQALSQGNRE